jgi:hypothetical protein
MEPLLPDDESPVDTVTEPLAADADDVTVTSPLLTPAPLPPLTIDTEPPEPPDD